MEQTSFELTPEQKGLLATLSRETGKPIPALLEEALEVLQEHERLGHAKGETNGNREATAPGSRRKLPSRYGNNLQRPAGMCPTKNWRACLRTWPRKWIIMSMGLPKR